MLQKMFEDHNKFKRKQTKKHGTQKDEKLVF